MIAICVCTHNRPRQLRELLRSLTSLKLEFSSEAVRVIVIDNSARATAASVFDSEFGSNPTLAQYVHEPRLGLAVARNRALDEAVSCGARLLAFIDDDELPCPDWLWQLISAIGITGAGAAIGPVYPLFEGEPPAWLPRAAYRAALEAKDGFVEGGYSGNCILDLKTVATAGLRFDETFNHIGGEDTAFFRAMLAAGCRIAWVDRAVVHEWVPLERMSMTWLWTRWARTGSTDAIIERSASPGLTSQIGCFVGGVMRIVAGSVRVGAALVAGGWRRPDHVMASSFTLCRGIGFIAGTFNKAPRGYGRLSRS
jgi:glycosyltransferase involved in cell wall biosynthesis